MLQEPLTPIIIKPSAPDFFLLANEIAARIGAKVNTNYTSDIINNDNTIIIFISTKGISAKFSRNSKEKPVFVDFTSGKIHHRQKNSGTRKEAIARAVGLKSGQKMSVLDATAGLGGDSFILASLGANMTCLERNPIVHLLLEDALARASNDINLAKIMQRIELIYANAIDFMTNNNAKYDVVYMDPMFPDKTKTALNKKEMRLFRTIVGEDSDIETLLTCAFKTASKRVVVKRPLRAPDISYFRPDFKIDGKAIRFDIYTTGCK